VGGLIEEEPRKRQDVVVTIPERRDVDLDHVQSKEEILTKDPLPQILVRRRDHPDVDLAATVLPNASYLALLERAEQLHLEPL
jgi:hypothetical protein